MINGMHQDNIKPNYDTVRNVLRGHCDLGGKYTFEDLKPFLKPSKDYTKYEHAFEFLDRLDGRRVDRGNNYDKDGYIDMKGFWYDGKKDEQGREGTGRLFAGLFNGPIQDRLIKNKNLSSIQENVNLFNLDCNVDDIEEVLIALYKFIDNKKAVSENNVNISEKFSNYNLSEEILKNFNDSTNVEEVEFNGGKYNKFTTKDNNDSTQELYIDNNGNIFISKTVYNNSEIAEDITIYNEFETSIIKYTSGLIETIDNESGNKTISLNDSNVKINANDRTTSITLNENNDALSLNIIPIYEDVEEGYIPKIIDINIQNNGQSIEFKDKEKLINLLNNKSIMFEDYQLKVTPKGKYQILEIIETQ